MDELVWFAMSTPYHREMKAKLLLDKYNIENFIPMHYEVVETKRGKERLFVPLIHNLLFVKTSRKVIQQIKTGLPYLQYRVRSEAGRNVPIIVPPKQMEQFIAVCQTQNEELIFLQPEEINLSKGTRVRIVGGMFDGIEGVFVKLKGKRQRRVVVLLDNIAAVATAEISPDLIQVLE